MPHNQGKPAEVCILWRRAVLMRVRRVKYQHHADGNHYGPNLAVLIPARLFKSFPFHGVHGIGSALQTFLLITHKLLCVIIDKIQCQDNML